MAHRITSAQSKNIDFLSENFNMPSGADTNEIFCSELGSSIGFLATANSNFAVGLGFACMCCVSVSVCLCVRWPDSYFTVQALRKKHSANIWEQFWFIYFL